MGEPKFINLNDLEVVATTVFLPVTFPNQLGFSSIDQVKVYMKEHSKSDDFYDHDIDHAKAMTVMMESYFGHFAVCRLPHGPLLVMWTKLMTSWVDTLIDQTRWIVPPDRRDKSSDYDEFVIAGKVKIDEGVKTMTWLSTVEKKVEKEKRLSEFHSRYRTRADIIILLSKFCFTMASRFYVVPVHLRPAVVVSYCKRYTSLRSELIDVWYDSVADSTSVIKIFNPQCWFVSLEPKTVAMKMFRDDLEVPSKQLRAKGSSFKRWFKRERNISLQNAKEINDEVFYRQERIRWHEAGLYAEKLFKTLTPVSLQIDQEERDFIDDDEDIVDHGDLDRLHIQRDLGGARRSARRMKSQFKSTKLINEEEADTSGNYKAYVNRILAEDDNRVEQKEKLFALLEEVAEEASDEEDGDDEMVDDDDDGDDDGDDMVGATFSQETDSTDDMGGSVDVSGDVYIKTMEARLGK